MKPTDVNLDRTPSALSYYRPCVGAMLFNDQGLVWVGKRISEGNDLDYAWQMPQGGIDAGEPPRKAVLRELLEETGTANARIVRESAQWFSYDLPENLLRNSPKSTFRGQIQKWFALRFNGEDYEFRLDTHDKPEFSTWAWVNLEEVPELIVPFKRDVYKNVVEEFKDLPERIINE
ncbi:MAG: RNA pyrophosphohydrolase [Rhodospirillales bacterium]|nr:RNA pyrophosphohydrolase [Rhodospirillales bacterium]